MLTCHAVLEIGKNSNLDNLVCYYCNLQQNNIHQYFSSLHDSPFYMFPSRPKYNCLELSHGECQLWLICCLTIVGLRVSSRIASRSSLTIGHNRESRFIPRCYLTCHFAQLHCQAVSRSATAQRDSVFIVRGGDKFVWIRHERINLFVVLR